jgi:hypothetical protein
MYKNPLPKLFISFLTLVFSFSSMFSLVSAQSSGNYFTNTGNSANAPVNTQEYNSLACPVFTFTRNIQTGAKGDDVYVLQTILNMDGRTVVSGAGLGAPGNETYLYGIKTREALKRFQALFIEYIHVADGKLNAKTKTVLNAVCKGPYFTGDKSCGVFGDAKGCETTATTTVATTTITTATVITTPLEVKLFGPAEISTLDDSFRVLLTANRAIKTPSLSGLILYNATAQDVRKISPTSFTFAVYPNQDAKNYLSIQIEADAISDLKDIKNDIASNEVVIKIPKGVVSTQVSTSTSTGFPDLDALLAQAGLPSLASQTLSGYTSATTTPVATSGSGDSGSGGGGGGGMEKIIEALMKMLPELMKAAKDGGGDGGPGGTCACPGPFQGHPMAAIMSLGGGAESGAYDQTLNPGAGKWTGKVAPAPGVCGMQFNPKTGCISPQTTTMGIPFRGILPPAPAYKWQQ